MYMKKDLNVRKQLKKRIVLFSILAGVVLLSVFFVFYIHASLETEINCQIQAYKLVPPQGKMVLPTNDEKKRFPGMTAIDIQFRAQLQCEENHKFLGIF